MKRFFVLAIAAALTAGVNHSAWSQGGQGGGSGAGAGAAGAAGAGAASGTGTGAAGGVGTAGGVGAPTPGAVGPTGAAATGTTGSAAPQSTIGAATSPTPAGTAGAAGRAGVNGVNGNAPPATCADGPASVTLVLNLHHPSAHCIIHGCEYGDRKKVDMRSESGCRPRHTSRTVISLVSY